jgi:hypothetical protein
MSLPEAVRYVLSIKTNVALILASAGGYLFLSGVQTFRVEFVTKQYGIAQALSSLVLLVVSAAGVIGVLAGGALGDYLLHRGYLNGRILVSAISAAAAVVLFIPAIVTRSPLTALPYISAAALFLSAQNPPSMRRAWTSSTPSCGGEPRASAPSFARWRRRSLRCCSERCPTTSSAAGALACNGRSGSCSSHSPQARTSCSQRCAPTRATSRPHRPPPQARAPGRTRRRSPSIGRVQRGGDRDGIQLALVVLAVDEERGGEGHAAGQRARHVLGDAVGAGAGAHRVEAAPRVDTGMPQGGTEVADRRGAASAARGQSARTCAARRLPLRRGRRRQPADGQQGRDSGATQRAPSSHDAGTRMSGPLPSAATKACRWRRRRRASMGPIRAHRRDSDQWRTVARAAVVRHLRVGLHRRPGRLGGAFPSTPCAAHRGPALQDKIAVHRRGDPAARREEVGVVGLVRWARHLARCDDREPPSAWLTADTGLCEVARGSGRGPLRIRR